MVAKRFQNPKGGLNEAGRKHFKKTTGSNLKRPVKSGDNPRPSKQINDYEEEASNFNGYEEEKEEVIFITSL